MNLFTLKDVNYKDILFYPNLAIESGGATFVVGESGSGKSTLLKLLNGTISANSGEILYNNVPITDIDPIELRRQVLLGGQNVFLFDGTIKQNFDSFFKYRDLPPLSDNEVLPYLNITHLNFPPNNPCATLSGGERQRVFIAVCLALKPKVLLLDEPTAALDDTTADTVLRNLKDFAAANGITLVIISHSQKLIETQADRIIKLEKRDVKSGTKDNQ